MLTLKHRQNGVIIFLQADSKEWRALAAIHKNNEFPTIMVIIEPEQSPLRKRGYFEYMSSGYYILYVSIGWINRILSGKCRIGARDVRNSVELLD